MTSLERLPFTLSTLAHAYAAGATPEAVIREAYRRLRAASDPGIFIHLAAEEDAVAAAAALGAYDPARPLWGVPFAVKDNIDVAGMPTTAACPAWAYLAAADAFVVAKLRAAGAIPLGKTNLDQFATGLVGVRSPYPIPRNALDAEIAPGGSSSGSAVVVALGAVAFALGTDTAGSGRVPAALNNIVGLKPTLGTLSATGCVPACRTLDTISIFALSVSDAHAAYRAAAGFDAADAYSRPIPTPPPAAPLPAPRIGVPDAASLRTFGDEVQAESFRAAVAAAKARGANVTEIDFAPLFAVAEMLYEGAWVAERHAVIADLMASNPDAIHPVTRAIVGKALNLSATDAFRGVYRLAELRRAAEPIFAATDCLMVPTIPRFVTRAELEADPIGPNSMLGTYTNFVNLLDLCALAVPTAARADGRPGHVTLIAKAGADAMLAAEALRIEAEAMVSPGATGWAPEPAAPAATEPTAGEIALAVCGAHMSGLPLNHELTRLGGRFLREARTTGDYRFYALAGGPPKRPGLVRQAAGGGAEIALEIWALPSAAFGAFIAGVPAPLGIGTIRLADGGAVKGFLCEDAGTAGAEDVTSLGGWRAVLARAAAA